MNENVGVRLEQENLGLTPKAKAGCDRLGLVKSIAVQDQHLFCGADANLCT